MHKYDDLLSHTNDSDNLMINDIVHDLISTVCITEVLDTIESAFKGSRSVARIKIECSLSIGTYELRHIFIVRECS